MTKSNSTAEGFSPLRLRPTRRSVLGGLAGLCLSPGTAFAEASPARVAALDWASALNLLALGIEPVAVPEKQRYGQFVVAPALPESTEELGLRSEPNLELLARLKPDLIVTNGELSALHERLDRIAPVTLFQPHPFGADATRGDPLSIGFERLEALADTTGRQDAFEAYKQSSLAMLDEAAQRLGGYDGRPVYLVTLVDPRRCLVFAQNSLYQPILDRFGIANAWKDGGTAFGHRTVTLDALTADPEARLVTIGDERLVRGAIAMKLPVLSSLAPVRAGRVTFLSQSLFYGGAPAALRFGQLLADALTAPGTTG
ncbi:ABC transporter substrate-binding protein [Roseibium suaedae]|uniref:Iron complex transport system substrate-binding protein n=1 Tax=Roseibium suaedae TaxID=735517 RepID=A0A1M7BU50_9HYPH|nr:ABC transporter substrate-binding protein [Roseibium suaedae]SHL58396.1 iron complex transport system substrate-binding protein [Roseibium suaedae]